MAETTIRISMTATGAGADARRATPLIALLAVVMVWTAAFTLALGASSTTAHAQAGAYTVSSGDQIRVTVFGEPDLSGEFELDATGRISFPLIGVVPMEGRTTEEMESELSTRLLDGYLVNPQVSVEILNYRPFYIIGEVNSPGSYPYQAGLSVLNAVALAGGFTFRADERDIEITRGGDEGRTFEAEKETAVLPGDVVRVKERFF